MFSIVVRWSRANMPVNNDACEGRVQEPELIAFS